jgi:hypothetical protein
VPETHRRQARHCLKGTAMINPVFLGILWLFALFGLAHIAGRVA